MSETLQNIDEDEVIRPLTMAKVYASNPEGSWTEIGTGEVQTMRYTAENDSSMKGDQIMKLIVTPLGPEGTSECLLHTFIKDSGVYNLHEGSTLLWVDEAIGKDIALSFDSPEGCMHVFQDIQAFQGSVTGPSGTPGRPESQWSVARENLQTILDAARSDPRNFGQYVRSTDGYWRDLAMLFHESVKVGDDDTASTLAEIALSLLRSPYTSDPSILAQVVDGVNDCIDMVQYGLGRKDRGTGFVSAEERQASFRNPCEFDDSILHRINVLYACNYLRDLLPLSLDEPDVLAPSPLIEQLEVFQNQLIEQICSSPQYLPSAFERHSGRPIEEVDRNGHGPCDLANFVLDVSKTVKAGKVDIEVKTFRYHQLFEAGMLRFFTSFLHQYFLLCDPQNQSVSLPTHMEHDICRAIQSICETLTHAVAFYAPSLQHLTCEATETPEVCTLSLIIRCVLVSRRNAVLHSAYDFLSSIFIQPSAETHRKSIIYFWVSGNSNPPVKQILVYVSDVVKAVLAAHEQSNLPPTDYREKELIASYGIKIVRLMIESSDESLLTPVWMLLQDTILSEISRFVYLDTHIYRDLQASLMSLVSYLIKYGERAMVAELCERSNILDTAVQRYIQCSRRNSIYSAALGSLVASVCAGLKDDVQRRVALPQFYSSTATDIDYLLESSGFPSFMGLEAGGLRSAFRSANHTLYHENSTADHPFRGLLVSLTEKYGAELRTVGLTLYSQICRALEASRNDHTEHSSSFPSSIEDISSPEVSPTKPSAHHDASPGEGLPVKSPLPFDAEEDQQHQEMEELTSRFIGVKSGRDEITRSEVEEVEEEGEERKRQKMDLLETNSPMANEEDGHQ